MANASSTAATPLAKRSSITVPPAESKAALAQIREERQGQYAVPLGLESGFVAVDDVKIHYVSGGSGAPLIFVYGFGSTWKMWEPALLHFVPTRMVIALDLPGLGQSEASKTGYNSPAITAYLLGAIRHLSDKPIDYVCHDLGNSVSYPLVANNQGYVKRAVFMDSPIPDKAFWTYPGLTPTGPGLGWHFGFSFSATLRGS